MRAFWCRVGSTLLVHADSVMTLSSTHLYQVGVKWWIEVFDHATSPQETALRVRAKDSARIGHVPARAVLHARSPGETEEVSVAWVVRDAAEIHQ